MFVINKGGNDTRHGGSPSKLDGHAQSEKEIAVNKLKLTGAVLATAVGLMFMTQPIFAADSSDANGTQAQAKLQGPERMRECEQQLQGPELLQG